MMASPLLFLRPKKSYDRSLLLALGHFPSLELRQRSTLFDPDEVTDRKFVLFVVGVYFFELRTVFFMTGWVKRRSTRTTTVLSCLSLTTTPCNMRFGISIPLRLRGRRTSRLAGTLLRRNCFDARDVASHQAHARRILKLTGCPLKTQVEPFFFQLQGFVVEQVDGHRPKIGRLHHQLPTIRRYAR